MQVQQRQDLGDLRGLAAPGRHDRRGEPLPLAGVRVGALVVDPRDGHLDRARHSWLDALSSAGALVGVVAVALGQSWGDPVAGLAETAFICHVGYEVTADVMHRLADGVDLDVITRAEAAAGSVPGVIHAHARARWTGRTLRVEIEGWVDPDTSAREADAWAAGSLMRSHASSRRQAPSPGPPAQPPPDPPPAGRLAHSPRDCPG